MSQESKHYQIIELGNGEIIVVHETWVSPEKQHVFWPPYSDNYSYRRSLEKREEPTAHWTIHPTKRVIYQTESSAAHVSLPKEYYTSHSSVHKQIQKDVQESGNIAQEVYYHLLPHIVTLKEQNCRILAAIRQNILYENTPVQTLLTNTKFPLKDIYEVESFEA
ncbi:hypothetical protein WA026_014225 [Henosepilachna vigintioctopunctata]|uniref:Uncharacterized protein n=1 Tax=Henosepilachna vigintioctopunctata TaxID=420089 RepID=A0AAW1TT22_9CUCU